MVEYVIVGQGIAGSLLGWQFYKRGISFRIIQSSRLPSSTSVAAGLLNTLHYRNIKKDWMADDFSRSSSVCYAELEAFFDEKFVHPVDAWKIITDDDVAKWQEAQKSSLPFVGVKTNVDLRKLGFTNINHFVCSPSGFLDGAKLMNVLNRFFADKGWLIDKTIDYSQITDKGNCVDIDGLEAEKIVFCEGANVVNNPWFGNNGPSPNKGELIEIYAPQLSVDFLIRGSVFVLPVGEGCFKIGATYSRKDVNNTPSQAALAELLEKARQIISVPFQVTNHWAGVRPAIRDRKPILGQHPDYPRFYVFNGLGSKGFVQAPYWANHLVDWLQGNLLQLNETVNVRRFFH